MLDGGFRSGASVPGIHDRRHGAITFRAYLRGRKYDYGRSSRAGWDFITFACGRPDLPDATSWPQLRSYLGQAGASPGLIVGAKAVWSSFSSYCSQRRNRA